MLTENNGWSVCVKPMERIPLVMWSGGLDSTYLVLRELAMGDIDVLEMEHKDVIPEIRAVEPVVRDHLALLFKELHEKGVLKGKIRKRLKAEFVYPFHQGYDYEYKPSQMIAWLVSGFINHHPKRHTSLLIGVLMGDRISTEVYTMEDAWRSMREMNRVVSQKKRYDRYPETTVDFPLLHSCIDKEAVWQGAGLSYEVAKAWETVKLATWSCQSPIKADSIYGYVPCKKCRSCVTRAAYDSTHKESV